MNQEKIDKLIDKMVDKAEADIDKLFAVRLKALHERISELYRKYSNNGELTWSDMNKYNRFEKEMELIKQELHSDYTNLFKEIEKLMIASYLNNYLRSGQLYEYEAQKPMFYEIPSTAAIKLAIKNPIDKLTLSPLMTQHRNYIIRRINIEISQALMGGEDYSTMAKRIEDACNFVSYKARRVARTEAGRSQVLGRMESAEHAQKYASLKKVWSATLDNEVRTSHRILDDQEADEDGYFHFRGHKAKGPHLFGVARLDINCRCDVLYLVNGKRPELRRERTKDGSNVIPYQPFEQWYEGLNKAS